MSGYRFCRTDDIPALVDAYNACWLPHFAPHAPLTVDAFKREAREIQLWASSCMLATEDDRSIGVLLGAKREDANLVRAIALRPGHERRGHGRHLLDSLRRKVAILGPRRLLAEVPAEWGGVRRFFERCGFHAEARYVDFAYAAPPRAPAASAALVSPITLEELREAGAFDPPPGLPWERSPQTLVHRSRQIEGLAVASDVRIEAYLLHRRVGGGTELLAVGGPRAELLHLLLAGLYECTSGPITFPKVSERETAHSALRDLGFEPVREHVGYAAELSES